MISGVVKNQNGNVELTNTKTSLTIDGTVENEQGNFKAVNSGHNGMKINGTVNNKMVIPIILMKTVFLQ